MIFKNNFISLSFLDKAITQNKGALKPRNEFNVPMHMAETLQHYTPVIFWPSILFYMKPHLLQVNQISVTAQQNKTSHLHLSNSSVQIQPRLRSQLFFTFQFLLASQERVEVLMILF